MNKKLKEFDPELYEKLRDDFDKYEIRSDEAIVIEDWIAKALVTEGLLGLLRKGLIDIVGLGLIDDQFEPKFKQNTITFE